MALLLSSVFGVAGCGSDEITQLEARVDALEEQAGSRVKNVAPEASGVPDASSKADYDDYDDYLLNLLNRLDLARLDLDDRRDLLDRLDLRDLLDLDLLDRLDLRDLLDLDRLDDEYEDDIAPRLDASDAPSKADCDLVRHLYDLLDRRDLLDRSDSSLVDRLDLYNLYDLGDILDPYVPRIPWSSDVHRLTDFLDLCFHRAKS